MKVPMMLAYMNELRCECPSRVFAKNMLRRCAKNICRVFAKNIFSDSRKAHPWRVLWRHLHCDYPNRCSLRTPKRYSLRTPNKYLGEQLV